MLITTGKCPKCETIVRKVKIDSIDASTSIVAGQTWKALSYSCTSCNTVLSVQIDPIAIKSDIVNELFEKLRK